MNDITTWKTFEIAAGELAQAFVDFSIAAEITLRQYLQLREDDDEYAPSGSDECTCELDDRPGSNDTACPVCRRRAAERDWERDHSHQYRRTDEYGYTRPRP